MVMPPLSLTSVERVQAYRKTPAFKRLFRYSMVSVVTTVFALGLLGLFYGVFRIASAAWCNLLATAITTVPSYYLNRAWAWGKTGKSHLTKEIIPFWVVAALSALISTLVVHEADQAALHVTHSHTVLTLVVEAANFTTYGLLWISKFMLFNKVLFKHAPHPHLPHVHHKDGMTVPAVVIAEDSAKSATA